MKRKISFDLWLISLISAILITFSVTVFVACSPTENGNAADTQTPSSSEKGDSPYYFDPDKIQEVLEKFEKESVLGLDKETITEELLKGFLERCGDDYAEYMTSDEYEDFNSSYQGDVVGIGVTVQYDEDVNGVRVVEVTPSSPAEEAGFQPYDVIIAVNGVKPNASFTGGALVDAFANMIRGEEGTSVLITVLRGNREVTLTATRRRMEVQSVKYQLCEYLGKKVAYIQIRSFDFPTVTQFKDAIDSAEQDGADFIIYDLRNNGGGLLSSVTTMLTYIVENKTLLTEIVYPSRRQSVTAGQYISKHLSELDPTKPYLKVGRSNIGYNEAYADHKVTIPSAVLVNRYTASAAELFTSVLRDYKLATIVGETTYGKGCMQVTYDFDDNTALKVTVALYNPPCGINYDVTTDGPVGIAPDHEVIFTEEENKANLYLLPHENDRQFVTAFNALTDGEKLPIPTTEGK
ncbi:MAG: S41 family peptidase [Clostridia bacterium]|nr:S41 family peptidase [Clostridia bacterium]